MMTEKDFDLITHILKEVKRTIDLDRADNSPTHEPPAFWRGHNEGMDYAWDEVAMLCHNTFVSHCPRFNSDKWCAALASCTPTQGTPR